MLEHQKRHQGENAENAGQEEKCLAVKALGIGCMQRRRRCIEVIRRRERMASAVCAAGFA
jgi:hypothetical protein